MCYMSLNKIKNENGLISIYNQFVSNISNSDGIGITIFKNKKIVYEFKELNYINANRYIKENIFNNKNLIGSIIMMHMRKSTGADISRENIHLWRISDFVVSHNGMFNLYDKSKTDSLLFFNKIRQHLESYDIKSVAKNLEDKTSSFSVIFAYDYKNECLIVGGNRKTFKIASFDDNIVISSDAINLNEINKSLKIVSEKTKLVFDFKLIAQTEISFEVSIPKIDCEIYKTEVSQSVCVIDIKNEKLIDSEDIKEFGIYKNSLHSYNNTFGYKMEY